MQRTTKIMPKIISLEPAVLEAAKVILAAEIGWSEISRAASNSQATRSELEAALFHDPSEKSLAALVKFDSQQKTVGDLQGRIIGGSLNPSRLIGARLNALLTEPLRKAIGELEKELADSIMADSDLAAEHGMTSTASPRTRNIKERIEVVRDCLRNVNDGVANPLKIFAKLGHALSDKVDAEAMSKSALNAVRERQKILATA